MTMSTSILPTPKIENGRISTDNAVKYIASVVYPGESPRNANKRIRARIRYAVDKGQLNPGKHCSLPDVDAAEFFDWAKSKWPPLGEVKGLPTAPIVASVDSSLPAVAFSGFGVSIPQDRSELEILYSKAATKLWEAESRIHDLESENAALKSELDAYKTKETGTKKKRSEAGKKGRGVPRR